MEQLSIVLDAESLSASSEGVLTGRLHLLVGGRPFPEADWNDFVAVVLAWWCEAVARFMRREARVAELRFVDGPFIAALSRMNEGDGIDVHLIPDHAAAEARTSVVSLAPLRRELLTAADLVLACAAAHRIDGDDIAFLRKAALLLGASDDAQPTSC